MQTKRQSWIEVATSTTIGFFGSWLITIITLHVVDNKWWASTITVILCTIWSLIRGYQVRRFFNRRHNHGHQVHTNPESH